MRYHNLLAAGIAFASAAAAQFIFPESSSNLQVNQAVQIRWNKANLQEPLSINLVPAGQVIRQDIVLQQVAVNIGNVGLFQWSADQTISAFPKFAMVIVDARSQVVVSQKFAISGLTKQPNQQIDLGNNGGNAGEKKNNNNNNNGNNNKNEKQKDKAKNNGNDKNGNSCDGGNQNDDKKKQKQNGQKEKATDKQQQNNSNNNNKNKGSSTLLPLPGLPPNGAPPVSLKPLPNAAESVPASKPAAAAPTPTATESSASSAAPAAGNEASSTSKPAPATAPEQPKPEPEPAAAEPVPTTAAASETVKEQPEPAQPAANGFTTLQPSADPASAPAKQVKAVVAAAAAAPVPESTLKAEAFAAGKYFREKTTTTTTSDVVFLTALGAQAGQDKTISTAITPVAPARFAASNGGGRGAEETQDSLAPDDAKPTVLSGEKSGAEKKVPGLALGLLGIVVVAGVALL